MFKGGDIVKLIPLNIECMVMDRGIDLETKKLKYALFSQRGRELYFAEESDMIFITTLEEEIEEIIKPAGNA